MAINQHIELINASGVTASATSGDKSNKYYRGAYFFFNLTSFTSTSGTALEFTVSAKDVTSGIYVPVAAMFGISALGMHTLLVYPGVSSVFSISSEAAYLPDTYKVDVIQVSGDVASYTVSASLVS